MDTSCLSISRLELSSMLGRANAPLVLDVRRPSSFAGSERIIATAAFCAPDDLPRLTGTTRPRNVVVYCVHGHDVSRSAAQLLRQAGWNARFLEGGIGGGEDGVDAAQDIQRWRTAPLHTIRKRPDFGVTGEAPSRWVTRSRPKIDRIACPWLIRRFIDPCAEFRYVPAEDVFSEAKRIGAVAFDIEGAPIAHEWERCSFDAVLTAFDLHHPALDTLAAIVRGADTSRFGIAPQAAGLMAVSLGLSRLHDDDQAMLAAAMPVYDALFAWCHEAQAEVHTWKHHVVEGGLQ